MLVRITYHKTSQDHSNIHAGTQTWTCDGNGRCLTGGSDILVFFSYVFNSFHNNEGPVIPCYSRVQSDATPTATGRFTWRRHGSSMKLVLHRRQMWKMLIRA